MAKRKGDEENDESTADDLNPPVTDISPEGHAERQGEIAKASQERNKALAGEPVEVEFLVEAVYDSEIHEIGSVVEMPELDARNLVHQGTVRYNTAGFEGTEKKAKGKKSRSTAAKSKK